MPLPDLRSKPNFEILLRTLQILEVKPVSWDAKATHEILEVSSFEENEIREYLMNFFKNNFSWFEEFIDERGTQMTAQEQQDAVVDMASRRLAERCGRTARGESIRKFRVKLNASQHNDQATGAPKATVELQIREPPLTEDNLGLKTWGSAWTMVQLLPKLSKQHLLRSLLDLDDTGTRIDAHHTYEVPRALELGAGTGLVGLAASAVWGIDVLLTDLPAIYENLNFNVDANSPVILQADGGNVSADILDWYEYETALSGQSVKQFEIIIAVDPLYDDEHARLLTDTIKYYSKPGTVNCVLTAVPLRDATTKKYSQQLENLMAENGFGNSNCGESICRDDWETPKDKEVMVRWILWSGRNAEC